MIRSPIYDSQAQLKFQLKTLMHGESVPDRGALFMLIQKTRGKLENMGYLEIESSDIDTIKYKLSEMDDYYANRQKCWSVAKRIDETDTLSFMSRMVTRTGKFVIRTCD